MKEIVLDAIKSAPPITVGTLTLLGISLSDWTLLLTMLYTGVMLYVLVRDKIWAPWCARQRIKQR